MPLASSWRNASGAGARLTKSGSVGSGSARIAEIAVASHGCASTPGASRVSHGKYMLLPGGDAGAPSVYPGECVGVPALFLVGLAIELSSWHELEQGNCVTGNDELTVTRCYRRSGDETGFG